MRRRSLKSIFTFKVRSSSTKKRRRKEFAKEREERFSFSYETSDLSGGLVSIHIHLSKNKGPKIQIEARLKGEEQRP
ncbi:hypothetical protein IC575_030413 [Cucumis melo]